MEGLIKRTWILAGVVMACGAFTMYVSPKRSMPVNEQWMAAHAPSEVAGYTFEPDPSTPDCSYTMSKSTYDTLQPSGILARVYRGSDGKAFDVVLIASDNSISFHDPRVCFTAQGYNISKERHVKVHTSSGDVPVTLVKMDSSQGEQSAMYFYRSPSGYESVARNMRMDMLIGELLHGRNDQGVFYRFIPQSEDISDQDLMNFVGKYLDAVHKTSSGFF